MRESCALSSYSNQARSCLYRPSMLQNTLYLINQFLEENLLVFSDSSIAFHFMMVSYILQCLDAL